MADANHCPELLADMALVDENGDPLQNVRMEGTIKASTGTHFDVFLDAADQVFRFPNGKVRPLRDNDVAIDYFVVVDTNIVIVKGLHLPKETVLDDYHVDAEEADAELKEVIAKLPPEPELASTAAMASNISPEAPEKPNGQRSKRKR